MGISNLDEQNRGAGDALEEIESDMDGARQIVPYLGAENSRAPYIGMEFQSLDDSFRFYLDYAHHRGKIASVLINQAGGGDHLNLTGQDIQNYLKTRRQKNLEKGDAQLMLHYFQKCQSENPGFFYAIQMDVEGRLANCFWVDASSRVAYKNFGEVVVFDPTYLTNKYRMPFVQFTGVNNHHQSILFGCALLWDETEDTFEWLLRTWKEAMFGVAPRTIITDQDRAITNAIAKVFPNSVHHFCMWHIEKKIPEHLSHVYHQFDDFKSKFSWYIHATTTPEEFETTWAEIIKTYNLEENSWLQRIYAIREKWIPAYVRTTFCAGRLKSSQRQQNHFICWGLYSWNLSSAVYKDRLVYSLVMQRLNCKDCLSGD
ncbi:protein FAR1-RELATED SEQUENCE 5-like [Lycium ferocissimum]|uniref:protein FAR1-RELATED SEQUENCE 5-like n=1 Tax=Lycium ferocissimum TaxID=112874 RepID=UPI0028167FEA|nr:protein FAR1-RELATED SEQUENCE 5-like [Lycium ferocissimum]